MKYWQKLQDPRWQRKRLEIYQRDGFKCQHCTSETKKLNVHHYYYIKDRDPWIYPDWALITLCDKCHDKAHADALDETMNHIESMVDIYSMQLGPDNAMVQELSTLLDGCFCDGCDPTEVLGAMYRAAQDVLNKTKERAAA